MFRHKEATTDETEKKQEPIIAEAVKPEPSLKELIEKNLKWSQIIYEQNRKINNKLLWSTIASWFYIIIILAPIVVGIIYLPPLLKPIISQYQNLMGDSKPGSSSLNLDNFFQMFNLDPAKQEQLKAIIK